MARLRRTPTGDGLAVKSTLCLLFLATATLAADANRLTYLDEPCDPYYVGRSFPKLITPQWVGEQGVDAVIVFSVDDMHRPEKEEAYLRPIVERLREIDGRGPVSVMATRPPTDHPLYAGWILDGISIEAHTYDHPCPFLQGGDLLAAKATYDRCVDRLFEIPEVRPVAFRFPCMDGMNSPSPRAYLEIFNQTTPGGHFLHISSSVSSVMTSEDAELPKGFALDADGQQRFVKYLPVGNYANYVENYPYPFVVGKLCWELPYAIPDDGQGTHVNGRQSPATLTDMKALVDATVLKKGLLVITFHPYHHISPEQFVEIVDYADTKYASRVKFLNFRECLERLNKNLLAGESLRAENGDDNGVRLLDIDDDGYLDVVIGNERTRISRVWSPERGEWAEEEFPVEIVHTDDSGRRRDAGVRFGVLEPNGNARFVVRNDRVQEAWSYHDPRWHRTDQLLRGLEVDGQPVRTARQGKDTGVRLRDVNGDGRTELIAGHPRERAVFAWDPVRASWHRLQYSLPHPIVDEHGRDAGLRFVDIDGDGRDDVIFSDDRRYGIHRFASTETGWSDEIVAGLQGEADAVPAIVRAGRNNGAWFSHGHMWVQNEFTDPLPGHVDRRSFEELRALGHPGETVVDMGSRRELLIDRFLIESLGDGATLRLHQPQRREIAVLHDAPWEGSASGFHTVFKDGDVYRMYYHGWHIPRDGAQGNPSVICYAESRDGIHWEKPDLGIHESGGSRANNIILTDIAGYRLHGDFSPFRDLNPDAEPDAPYKAVALSNDRVATAKGLWGFKSTDAIHWEPLSPEPIFQESGRVFDTQNITFWSETEKRYVLYYRKVLEISGKLVRSIKRATSQDYETWEVDGLLDYGARPPSRQEQYYTNQIRPYYRAPHLYLGFPSRYVERPTGAALKALPGPDLRRERSQTNSRYGQAVTDALFMTSRDGRRFHVSDEAFLRPGLRTQHNWAYGDNFMAWGMVETASGFDDAPPELSMYATESYFTGKSSRLRRYALRVDGFGSVHAPLSGGEVITKTLRFTGDELRLNFATAAAGSIHVEIQGLGGEPIRGYALADCEEVFGDALDQPVYWKSAPRVAELAGRAIRLRFVLRDANLYAFRFATLQ